METIIALQQFASPALDAFALAITNLGNELTYIALLVVTYLAIDSERGRSLGIYFLVAMYLNGELKALFETPRPYLIDQAVLRPGAETTVSGAGIPSGHAQGAASFWGVAALYVRRPWFTALAALLVILVGLSRIYLGVHMPLDVMVGLLLGALLVALVPFLDRVSLPLPAGAAIAGGLLAPLAVHLLFPNEHSGLLLGGLAGFLTAPYLYRYQPPRSTSARALVAFLGLAFVFGALFGSSMLLPETVKDHPVGAYLRYLLLAYVGLLLVPYLVTLAGRRARPARAKA